MELKAQKDDNKKKSQNNGFSEREEQKLTLRKRRMKNKNQTERMEAFASKFNVRLYSTTDSYEINMNYLTVTQNIPIELKTKSTSIEQISYLVNYLNAPNIYDKKFAVKSIERILFGLNTKSFEEVRPVINTEFTNEILGLILADGEDKQVMYECSKIVCYLIFYDEAYANNVITSCPSILKKVREQRDRAIQGQLLWVICQVMEGNQSCYNEVMKLCEDLPGFIFQIIADLDNDINKIYELQDVLPCIFWVYSIMLQFSENNYAFLISKAFQDIPIIAKFMRTRINMDLLKRAMEVIQRFCELLTNAIYDENKELTKGIPFDSLFRLITQCDITQNLIENLNAWDDVDQDIYKNKEIKESILKSLCYLSCLDDELPIMMKNDIIESLVLCLKKYEERKYKISRYEVIFDLYKDLLENSPPMYYERMVKKSEILKIAINKYQNKELVDIGMKKKLIEILYLILVEYEQMTDLAIVNLICIQTPEFLFDQLKEYEHYEEDFLHKILDSICSFFDYSWQFDPSSKTNYMVELAKKNGVKDVFDRIASNEQVARSVSEQVEKILDKYFKESDI